PALPYAPDAPPSLHAPDAGAIAAFEAAALDEPPEEISEVTPIDSLLAVEVSTYYAADEDATYFEAAISRAGEKGLPQLPKDVLLVQDCSKSMTRAKLDFFKEGIREFLPTLSTADRVNFIKYADSPEWCFADWRPVTGESLGEVWAFAERMTARGETDLYASLRGALEVSRVPGRPVLLVLMTDGRPTVGVLDASDIIARFSKANKGRISVFTVGGGESVNSFLLDLLAQNNRGDTWMTPMRDRLPDTLKRAGRELSRPVLADLRYSLAGDGAAEVYPKTLTHLFLDRPLRLVGRTSASAKEEILRIEGDSGTTRHDMVFALDLENARNGGEGLRREWVMQKIYALVDARISGAPGATAAAIRELAAKHRVALPWNELPVE
ncbi:MAG: VWA domain-containing protein, partial [Kiritimatiellae bacterium]|nr:VWA domain-containing protein [Kiritimatiellia bacterium]